MLQVPLMDGERLASTLFALSAKPRRWTEYEMLVLSDVAARTYAAIERARSTKAMRDSEALLRAIGQSSAELIYAKDRQQRLLYANAATMDVIGRPFAECVGHSEREWHHDAVEAEAILAFDEEVMSRCEIVRKEERFTPPGGSLASELRAAVTLDFQPEGLCCRLVAPVSGLEAQIGAATDSAR